MKQQIILVIFVVFCTSAVTAWPKWGMFSSSKQNKTSSSHSYPSSNSKLSGSSKSSSSHHSYPSSKGISGTSNSKHYTSKPVYNRATARTPVHRESVIKPSYSKPSYASSAPKFNTSEKHTYPRGTTSRPASNKNYATGRPAQRYPSVTPSSTGSNSHKYGVSAKPHSYPSSVTTKRPTYIPITSVTVKPSYSSNSKDTTKKPWFSFSLGATTKKPIHGYPSSVTTKKPIHRYPSSVTTKKPIHVGSGSADFISSQSNSNTNLSPVKPPKPYPTQAVNHNPIVNIHIPPVQNQPYHGNIIGQPVYPVSGAYYQPYPTYIYEKKEPSFSELLAEIIVARELKARYEKNHRPHYHGSGYTHQAPKKVSKSQTHRTTPRPDVLTNCTMTLRSVNETTVIALPCELASTFIIKNATVVPPLSSTNQTNCNVEMIRNGVSEITTIQCERINILAPVTELPPARLNCIQQPFNESSGLRYTPCTLVIPTDGKMFPLGVIPLNNTSTYQFNNETSTLNTTAMYTSTESTLNFRNTIPQTLPVVDFNLRYASVSESSISSPVGLETTSHMPIIYPQSITSPLTSLTITDPVMTNNTAAFNPNFYVLDTPIVSDTPAPAP